MKSQNFRIVPLRSKIAEAARQSLAAGAPDHVLVTANSPTGYPCRHCLCWAKPGERLVLFPYASVSPGHPYSESGPIFVHAEPCERYAQTDQFPANFKKGRVIRAYDSAQMMIDAVVVKGDEPEAIVADLLENPETQFLQVRSVTRGCYTLTIERA